MARGELRSTVARTPTNERCSWSGQAIDTNNLHHLCNSSLKEEALLAIGAKKTVRSNSPLQSNNDYAKFAGTKVQKMTLLHRQCYTTWLQVMPFRNVKTATETRICLRVSHLALPNTNISSTTSVSLALVQPRKTNVSLYDNMHTNTTCFYYISISWKTISLNPIPT